MHLLLLLGAAAAAAGAEGLGALEKEAADEALSARGLTVDPTPQGKSIREVHVVTLEVFSPRDGFPFVHFQWANVLHRTTRETMIRREALFRPGDRYDQTIADETARNLRSPTFTSLVVILPVRAPEPGTVDVLIVTRDIWSLRLNTDFEYQEGTLIALNASLSENNLFGWRKTVAFVFDMNLSRMSVGPTYYDPNIAGTRLTLRASARALFRRDGGNLEGSATSASLAYPLFSLASKWGASIDAGHSDAVSRRFLGTSLYPVDFRETPERERWPWVYRIRQVGAGAGVVRSFPGKVTQRVSAGYRYSVVRPSFTREFVDDPAVRAQFAKEIFPRSERVSSVYAEYGLFTPDYRLYRDFNTFDLREDFRLGPSASVGVSRAIPALGSEVSYSGFGVSAAWGFALGGGYQSVSASWGARHQNGRVSDQQFSAGLYAASPVLARLVRVLASVGATAVVDDTQNWFAVLGGENGLRGYTIGDRFGRTASLLGHLEVRSMAIPLASLRLGGLVFWDVGDAGTAVVDGGNALARAVRSVIELVPHQDVGFGLRLLIPQLDPYVLRFDWAFAMRDTLYTRAGWPGRISIGFRQVF